MESILADNRATFFSMQLQAHKAILQLLEPAHRLDCFDGCFKISTVKCLIISLPCTHNQFSCRRNRSSHKDQSRRVGLGVHDPSLEDSVTRKLALGTNRAMFNWHFATHLYSKSSCTWSAPQRGSMFQEVWQQSNLKARTATHVCQLSHKTHCHKSSTTPCLCRMKSCEQMLRKLMGTAYHVVLHHWQGCLDEKLYKGRTAEVTIFRSLPTITELD